MSSLRRRFSFRRGSINDRTRMSLRKNSDIQKFGVSSFFDFRVCLNSYYPGVTVGPGYTQYDTKTH